MEKILIIDDDESFGETLRICLSEFYSNISITTNGIEGLNILKKERPDLVITDLKMPELDGLEVLKQIKEFDSNIEVILITAFDDMESIIKAMQLGAYDYIEKSFDLDRIKIIVKIALESKKKRDSLVIPLADDISEEEFENSIVGQTALMKEIFKKIGKISSTRVNVLIQGESGTGKELITKIIHYKGITKDYPFVAVNCTALSESLLESELFGHEKGAFTGAVREKKGKFELAGEGTIFLDEISEISQNLQVKLLRVIQEKEFERVGGEEIIQMRARIVAATNRKLLKLVEEGKFREDLFYRLNIFTINIAPLRERKEDIPKLVVHFMKKINKELHKNVCKVPYEVMELLQNHEWVGNVRELENTLMQAILLAKSDVLEKENIMLNKGIQLTSNKNRNARLSLAEVEKSHIKLVLDDVNWNKEKASSILGIAKTTLYNKIDQYKIDPPSKSN